MKRPTLFPLVLALAAAPAAAADILVPDDQPTIQAGIDAAQPGDAVLVRPGTWFANLDFRGKAIAVRSLEGPEVTVIDGSHPVDPGAGSVVLFQSGEGPAAVLEGFTLTRGTGTADGWRYGGAICCKGGASPTIRGNVIVENQADIGGGICLRGGASPRIEGNVIRDNVATQEGGGVRARLGSNALVLDNRIEGNQAGYAGGGVLFGNGGAPLIRGNEILDNHCAYDGGGISCDYDVLAVILDNEIVGNSAGYSGGGIAALFYAAGNGVTISNNLVRDNTAGYPGGGIALKNGGDCALRSNTVVGNLTLVNGGVGSGIYCGSWTDVVIRSCIVRGNADHEIEVSIYADAVSVEYSDVEGGFAGTGNLDVDPLFVDPAVGDYRLQQDPAQPGVLNPCVDGGDPLGPLVVGTTRTDLVLDVGRVDMGYHYPVDDFPGVAFCFGDPGSGTPCPCGNDNDGSVPGSGCANGVDGAGARLFGGGLASVAADGLVLSAVRLQPNQSGLFLQGDNALNGGAGLVFGDGLRCAGGNLVRLQVRTADASGSAATTVAIAARGGVAPGDVKHYQCWYRNTTNPPCGAGVNDFNLTNGYRVLWLP